MVTKTTTNKAKKPAGGKGLAPEMQVNAAAAKRAKARYRAKENISGYTTMPVYKKSYKDIFAEERAKGNGKKDTGKPATRKTTSKKKAAGKGKKK